MRAQARTYITVCKLAFDVIGIKTGEENSIDVLSEGNEVLAYDI